MSPIDGFKLEANACAIKARSDAYGCWHGSDHPGYPKCWSYCMPPPKHTHNSSKNLTLYRDRPVRSIISLTNKSTFGCRANPPYTDSKSLTASAPILMM